MNVALKITGRALGGRPARDRRAPVDGWMDGWLDGWQNPSALIGCGVSTHDNAIYIVPLYRTVS